jgi:hypothetical protein
VNTRAAFSAVITLWPRRRMVLKTYGMATERVICVLAQPGSATFTVTPVPLSLRASSYVQSKLISFARL